MNFNARKAAQTIAYFCLKNGGRPVNVLKAVKLVYIADRESIRHRGHPIQNDRHVSMPHGPVNSMTLSFIDGAYADNDFGWSDFVSDRQNHDIGLSRTDISVSDLDELSRADLKQLDAVWEQFGSMGQYQLRDWTHDRNNVPEWEDPDGSSRPFTLERIFAAVGYPESAEHAAEVKSLRSIDEVFSQV